MDDLHVLPRFKGTMVHDFWASYFKYPCRHALCNSHLLRGLIGIAENYGQKWCEQMHDLLLEIKDIIDGIYESSSSLSHQQIAEFEKRYRQIIEMGILENPVLESPNPVKKRGRKKQSKAKNLLDRCQKFERKILLFMHDFTIPFPNNQAERDLRMAKLQQKLSGTFRILLVADCFCRVRGYISTVKKNQLQVLASLVEAFNGKPFIPSTAHKTG
jgi:transposase